MKKLCKHAASTNTTANSYDNNVIICQECTLSQSQMSITPHSLESRGIKELGFQEMEE